MRSTCQAKRETCRLLHVNAHPLRMGRIFDSYSNIRTFCRYLITNSKICSCLNENHSNIFLHILRLKIGPWLSFTFRLNYEKLQLPNNSSHILLLCICIHTLGYKIKSLTLLKRTNFTKQNKLAKNSPTTRSRQDISTPFSILIEFGATEYSYSIQYSIRV